MKLSNKSNYTSQCMIFSPHGIIEKGITMSGEQWKNVLVYEIGNSGKNMLKKVKP